MVFTLRKNNRITSALGYFKISGRMFYMIDGCLRRVIALQTTINVFKGERLFFVIERL